MKKHISKLILLIILLIPFNVKAAPSGNLSCSSSGSVTVGNTITVTVRGSSSEAMWDTTLSYDSSKLQKVGGSDEHSVGTDFVTSVSYSYTFKAINEGSAYVKVSSAIADYTGTKAFPSSSCNISVSAQASKSQASINNITNNKSSSNNKENNKNLSSDNALKSLSVEGFEISPKFNKDTLEYKVDLTNDTTKIKIITEKNDEKATVSGDGEVEVKEGNNAISITVTAENGATRTYKINAYVKEKDPITVTINKKKYTVLKKLIGIDKPTGFESKTIKIEDNEIDAFYNEKLKFTIVGLKDSIGNVLLYLYDEKTGKYTKYSPIVGNGLHIIILDFPDNKVPHRYHKSKFIYNDEVAIGYALSEKSDFRVVYGVNVETGEKNLFLYDMKDGSIQRFYNDQVNVYINLVSKIKLAFIILGGFIIFLTIIILILLSKNAKFKKKYLEKRLNSIDNPIKTNEVMYQDLEGTTNFSDISDLDSTL